MYRSIVVAAGLLLALVSHVSHADELMTRIHDLQREWAVANYQTDDKAKQSAFEALVAKAEALNTTYPQRAEPKVWEAIIRAGLAGSMGGLSSLFNAMPQMKQGRDLLLEAEGIDPQTLNGSVYTTLGSFYYMVPGGLIGFGDDAKALGYLEKALQIAPDDMDANYFAGDYWLEQGQPGKAKAYFEKVLALPAVSGRPVYSEGRKAEASAKLAQVNAELR